MSSTACVFQFLRQRAPFDNFFPLRSKQVFLFACVWLLTEKQDGYVAHMWEMFRQGTGLGVYSPTQCALRL